MVCLFRKRKPIIFHDILNNSRVGYNNVVLSNGTILFQCCRFFNNSTKRQTFLSHELEQLENPIKRQKLKELCRIRWVQRHDAFEVFMDFFPAVVDALNGILETEKRSDAVTETNGILHAITTFQFIITLVVILR